MDKYELNNNKVIEFAYDKTYIYDFTELTLEQAEIAREIAELKVQQLGNELQEVTIDTLLNTKSAEWKMQILSYLLLEKQGDIIIPFDVTKIKDTEKFVKSIKTKDLDKVKEVIDDFFTNIGLSMNLLSRVQSVKNKLLMQTLLQMSSIYKNKDEESL